MIPENDEDRKSWDRIVGFPIQRPPFQQELCLRNTHPQGLRLCCRGCGLGYTGDKHSSFAASRVFLTEKILVFTLSSEKNRKQESRVKQKARIRKPDPTRRKHGLLCGKRAASTQGNTIQAFDIGYERV